MRRTLTTLTATALIVVGAALPASAATSHWTGKKLVKVAHVKPSSETWAKVKPASESWT